MQVKCNNFKISILLLIVFLIYFAISLPDYSGDVKNHVVWAQSILSFGPLGFYERDFPGFAFPNYPPLAMALFTASLKLYQLTNQLVWFLNTNLPVFPSKLVYFVQWENVLISFLKLPAILSNIGIAVFLLLLLGIVNQKNWVKIAALLSFVLNPAALYLSTVWGQIDYLPLFFLLFSIYFILKKKFYLPVILISLSILSKQTVIIFLPIFFYLVIKQFGWKRFLISLGLILGIFILSYVPFNNTSLIWPFEIYKKNFDMVAYSVAEDSLNFWGILFNFQRHSDLDNFLFFSYQHWGYILYTLFITLPAIKFFNLTKSVVNMLDKGFIKNLFSFLLILSLSYFFFLTRMHERYLAPAIVFSVVLSFFDRKYIPVFLGISVINLVNLYKGLYKPEINFLVILANTTLVLNLLVLIYIWLMLYSLIVFLRIQETDE